MRMSCARPARRSFPRRCVLIFAWLASMLLAGAAPGEFRIANWTTSHGLPANDVRSVLVSRDGYLWAGTYFGLARFDGARFTVFDAQAVPSMSQVGESIVAVVQDNHGALWIGSTRGLLRLENGAFSHFDSTNGLPHENVLSLASGADGVWIGTHSGLGRFRRGELAVLTNAAFQKNAFDSLLETRQGMVYTGTRRGLYRFHRNRAEEPHLIARGTSDFITHLAEDAIGRVWFKRGKANSVFVIEGDAVRAFPIPNPDNEADYHASALAADRYGVVVVAGRNGHVFRFSDEFGTERLGKVDATVSRIEPMPDGSLWMATRRSGLVRFTPSPVRTYATGEIDCDKVFSVCADSEGNVWLGTDCGVLRWRGGALTRVPFQNDDRKTSDAHSVYISREGDVWAARADLGLWRLTGEHFVQQFASQSIKWWSLRAIYQDADGTLWVGGDNVLARVTKTGPEILRDRKERPTIDIRCILPTGKGDLLLATRKTGLWRWRTNQFEAMQSSLSAVGSQVNVLRQDREGHVWVGTDGGLKLFTGGKWFSFSRQHGLFDNAINHIEEDAYGRLWFSCNRGLFWILKQQLLDLAAGRRTSVQHVRYGESDGMLSAETNGEQQPAGCQDARGRLWFPTQRGVVRVDPADIPVNPPAPNVVIETVAANGETVYHDRHSPLPHARPAQWVLRGKTQTLRLPPGSGRHLEINYTAPVFDSPERVQFEYRLEGQDRDWIRAGSRRVAHYNNLRPGDYLFRVRAANSRGVWNESGTALALRVAPRFTQTWWFWTLLVAGICAVGGACIVYRLNVHRRMLALQHAAALEQQRRRIAQDMHDELGAGLTKISILSEVARRELGGASRALPHMDAISATSREIVGGLNEIVWAVNPANDTLDSLCAYLREHAAVFFERSGVECSFDIPLDFPNLPISAEFRRNVFLAGKELITNVARHAAARNVKITARLQTEEQRPALVLSVEDDGRGFDESVVGRFSHGLENVRKRTNQLGGTVAWETRAQGGTVVKITVPLSATQVGAPTT